VAIVTADCRLSKQLTRSSVSCFDLEAIVEDMTIAQAVATVKRVAEAYQPASAITPAPMPVDITQALDVVAGFVNNDQVGLLALTDIRRTLQAHMDVTWYLARWHDHQIGGVGLNFSVEYTRRWLQLMDAFRAAMEL
jgi:hypothetical protein